MDNQAPVREQTAATPIHRYVEKDHTLMLLEQQYDRVLKRYGIPAGIKGQPRPQLPDDISREDLRAAHVELEKIVDAIAYHSADLIEQGRMVLQPRNNNPFYIAMCWVKERYFGFKPALNERIWRELDRRDAIDEFNNNPQ